MKQLKHFSNCQKLSQTREWTFQGSKGNNLELSLTTATLDIHGQRYITAKNEAPERNLFST